MITSTRAALVRFAASPWAVAVVVLAGIAVPLLGSVDRQFYALEADLILAAQLDADGLREILAGTLKDQSPLYLWILHAWTWIFSDGEMAIRAVSFGFGAAAVFYTYLLGRSWRNHWVGLAAAVLLICMPAFTEHARTARMYILYVAFVTGAMAHAARYLRGGSGWELLGVGVLATAGIYNHFLGFGLAALVLGYLIGGSLAVPPRRRAIWTGVTAAAVAAISIPQILRFSAAWHRAGNKGTFYSVSGSVEEFLRSVNMGQFFSGIRLGDVIPLPAPAPFWIVFGLLLVVTLWGVSKLDRRWDQLGALAWFAGGEAALLYLRVARNADVRNRYLSFVIPVFAVLLASALIERRRGATNPDPVSLRRRIITWATAAAVVALTVGFCVGTGGQFDTRTRPYGDVMAWIERQAGENDVVGTYPGWT
ncbi:MAG: glycosyltransferase family 39 protein, partial [Myxococcota bacterium]|nr:glycosyltransferase family 39 protein [Myxococcota bacterium]